MVGSWRILKVVLREGRAGSAALDRKMAYREEDETGRREGQRQMDGSI